MDTLRARLPGATSRVFLNYAATAPMLTDAADELQRVARDGLEPLALHFDAWFRLLEGARGDVARLVGASPHEIAFTTSTSSALSIAAASVAWRAGDRVLFPADEFPSNRYVWQTLAEQGVRAEPVAPEPGRSFREQLASMDLSGVRLVAFSHVSFRDGRREDPGALVRALQGRDILVCVDGIQGAGAVPVALDAWGVDFYACGGQKWLLGPVGSAFLFVRSRILDALRQPLVGWASARSAPDVDVERYEPCDGARRLEPGLPDVASVAGLAASVRALQAAGLDKVHARVREHEARLRDALGARVLSPDAPRAGIVAFDAPSEADAAALAEACVRANILLTRRGRTLRVAAHATTSDADRERFLALADAAPVAPRAPMSARPAEAPPVRGVAVVTGASRGLGQAIAASLAARGYEMLALSRASVDLADAASLARWIEAHREPLARCDVLVNAAASADAMLFRDMPEERVRAAFETNVFAPMALAQAVLPGMLARGRGAILNVVASGGRCAFPLFSTYAASKGALWSWSESLARELARTGVTVTTFLPPHMETATRRHLGRSALAHYDVPKGEARAADPRAVAERAVAAALGGRAFDAPWGARVQVAADALAPALVTRRILRSWRG